MATVREGWSQEISRKTGDSKRELSWKPEAGNFERKLKYGHSTFCI